MLKDKSFINSISILLLFFLAGCVQVEPWDREYLAQEQMALDPYPLASSFKEHAYFSREGTSGGFSPDAGGCGCN